MIIELFGLPGAGKTSVINAVKGTGVIGVESENAFKRGIINFLKKISLCSPLCVVLRHKVLKVLADENLQYVYFKKTVLQHVNNIVLVAFGYVHSKNKKLFMDEGIIHRIVSFAVNYNLSVGKTFAVLDVFHAYLDFANVFYLKCSVEDCFEGIKKRNRHSCDMDELDDSTLIQFLISYQKYFKEIQKKYNYPIITRDNYSAIEVKNDIICDSSLSSN